MTAPTTTRSDPELYRRLARFHGHRCPMSILGARLGLAALDALAPPPGARLSARFSQRTCALDGIQVATGCTLGNGNLAVEPRAGHRLELGLEGGTPAVAVCLTQEALARGRAFARLRDAAEALDDGHPDRCSLERDMEAALAALETAPTGDLVRPDAASP